MRVLFIDLSYHKKTKSADFFLSLLRTHFEVDTLYYDEMYKVAIPQSLLEQANLVIVWQALLARNQFVPPGKPCVYVPMYDNLWGSIAQWKRIARSGTRIISFCEKVSAFAKRGGVADKNLLEVRYAFDPKKFQNYAGDPDVLAVWERGFFGLREVKKLFPPGFFKKIILFRRPQPGLEYVPVCDADLRDYNVTIFDSDFLPEEEYLALLQEPGVYIAPRPKEGIGMSFLEQLAMGKCVIAHDDGTMNEYIRDGVNGFIRDFRQDKLETISKEDILRVRSNVVESAMELYTHWKNDSDRIIPFLLSAEQSKPVRFGGIVDLILRGAYLGEAMLNRLRS